MRRIIARAVFVALAMSASTLSLACGGSSTGPPPVVPPPVVPPTPVTVVSLIVAGGPLSLLPGAIAQPEEVTARFSDNTTKVVKPDSWASNAPAIASVASSGVITGLTPGQAQITATYQGISGARSVTVMTPPPNWWSSLSDAAKVYLLSMRVDESGTARWNQSTIKVWAQPGFEVGDLQAAFDMWQQALNGKISFVLVSDSTSGEIIVAWNSGLLTVCGLQNPSRYGPDGVITGGIMVYSTRTDCQGDALYKKMRLAHGLGHVLAALAHTSEGTDIMSSPDMRWVMSPLLLETSNAIYSAPPRSKP